jgi:hypothetical protein
MVSSAKDMGPAFRQWLGTGPGRCRHGCGMMMTAVAGRGQACGRSPTAWDHPGPSSRSGILWAAAGSAGTARVCRKAERSELLWFRRVLRLAVLPGREDGPFWLPSLREGRGCGGSAPPEGRR